MPAELPDTPFSFGANRVDPRRRMLWTAGEPTRIGSRAFDVLMALIERRGRLVHKQEVLEAVWPGGIADDNTLRVQISALRKALGPDVIVTVPGGGYRFSAVLEGDAPPVPLKAPEPVAPRPAADRALGNLPAQIELYGRDDDICEVCRLVESRRLVTITGAGGIGKSRTAQAVAHALSGRQPDGAWLVELAPLTDPALLPASVARALGLQLTGQRSPHDELAASLGARRLLLILDNCEHLLDAAGLLAQALLDRTAEVRLLVTSQEALRLPSEHVFRLGTLGMPEDGSTFDAATALGFGAVRLFVERVQALDARFRLDDHNVGAVVDICRRLDGLALAIELAAARVPSLGVPGVHDRLGERLRMLTAGSRMAPQRHQTLRAALDWSHGLLDDKAKAVFRRLGVFSGGCTMEAAQQVAGDEQLDEWDVLDQVAALVDRSLLVVDEGEPPRYRMLESARLYAREKLAEAQESDALAGRHAAFFAAAFQRADDALFAAELTEDAFVAMRAQELDNLRAALAWSLRPQGEPQTALRLLAHAAPACYVLPSYRECEDWRLALSARLDVAALPPRERALYEYTQLLLTVQRLRLSAPESERPSFDLVALRALDSPLRLGHALCILAVHAAWRGASGDARAALDAFDRLELAAPPLWLLALRLYQATRLELLSDSPRSELPALQDLLARLEASGQGDTRVALIMRTLIAEDSLVHGRFQEAVERFTEVAATARRQRRDAYRMCFALASLALALTEVGRLDEAREVAIEALPWLLRTGMRSDCAPVLALLAARRGHPDTAARLLGAGDAALARSGGSRLLAERRARAEVLECVESTSSRSQLEAWLAEGAELDDDGIARLVLYE